MKNSILFLILCLFLKGNLFGQNVREIANNPITKEYFLAPLKDEIKKEYPSHEFEVTQKAIQDALKRAIDDCKECFTVLDTLYYSATSIKFQKSLAVNNFYNIDFKDYLSFGNFIPSSYIDNFIDDNPYISDFKSFKNIYLSKLKAAGVKSKADQEELYNEILKKKEELGSRLVQFYAEYDNKIERLENWGKRYPQLYEKSNYLSDELEKLVLEKISPHFNPIDNLLIYPKLTGKKNTEAENESLKKMFLDKGWVEITEWENPSDDGFTFIFPKIGNPLKERADTLVKYFNLKNIRNAKWRYSEHRILELWYGNLSNEFSLKNFLEVCGDNVPSKDDFIEDGEELKQLIDDYVELLNGRIGGDFVDYDETLKMRPKEILLQNIINNHYGIESDELKQIRKNQIALKEKEAREKGGELMSNSYYKINSQDKFDHYYFLKSLHVSREINQSKYWGNYEKKGDNLYEITLTDERTGIKLPAFEARLSSDRKKLYIGEDKVPYIYDDYTSSDCLTEKSDMWFSLDEKESFSTIGSSTWRSSITGGISAEGGLFKISNNKYAFVIYNTSWGGTLENNLVVITTSDDNCDTIYYGKGRKKMVIR